MAHNYYSEINLHVVWHTKNSLPLLTPTVEPATHLALRKRIVDTADAFVHEIGGTETHVHVAVTIPPTLTISEWIGKLKGGTSHDVNQQMGKRQKVVQWQTGYGVVSFGTGDCRVGEGVYPQPARTPRAGEGAGPPGTDHAIRRRGVTAKG
ncbi:MAG TPA: IS200/IS605 family transposase [Thermoguttaceae bacterium]|nr:IS200/IS605 family transposase [Thermoguttaceae bacterium]